ncbi:putative clathrin assembly protein At1g68110 [Gossypium hirsutum]|uniref:Clathrin assembly protein At1g68110 n=1 Tax=Gossypium hirsutum TaxID=3635 RepID=A0A1U8J117_GOSHI|nr:putative clathrin assembly protein At1g68110 [Gossypium hirsutum]
MGRLPFDFSDFTDGHSKLSKTWGFNAFIHDYYAFLDKRAALSYDQHNQKAQYRHPLMLQSLLNVQNLQFLLGLLLKVRLLADNMNVGLIIEAMNCVTVEIFDFYSKICNEIVKVEYYGTPTNANELPTVTQILEEDVQQKLERIANDDSDKTCRDIGFVENEKMAKDLTKENLIDAIVGQIDKTKVSGLETIITDKWVVFYENLNVNGIKNINTVVEETAGKDLNLIPIYHYEIPDLITF